MDVLRDDLRGFECPNHACPDALLTIRLWSQYVLLVKMNLE